MINKYIEPQKGAQYKFLSTKADIAFYGGAAGGGKTFALLLEAMRHTDKPGFRGAIFRRQLRDIRISGGLLDESSTLYEQFAKKRTQPARWTFHSGASIDFCHLDKNNYEEHYRGSQFAFIGMDELIDFTEYQFFFMESRCRTTCGIKPYIRAATNPDPDSWVRGMIDWWLDKDGYPIYEKGGIIRHFVRYENRFYWGDTEEEAKAAVPSYVDPELVPQISTTFTYIPAKIDDNKILMEHNPHRKETMKGLDPVRMERYLRGNWNIRESAGMYFKRDYFTTPLPSLPHLSGAPVRYWDMACRSEPGRGGDYLVGLKLGKYITPEGDHMFVVMDVVRKQVTIGDVDKELLSTAQKDGIECKIGIPQDPGAAGVTAVDHYKKLLKNYNIEVLRESGSKLTRARPASAVAEGRRMTLFQANWNENLIKELESFPDGRYDDQVDALSNAYSMLTKQAEPNIRFL